MLINFNDDVQELCEVVVRTTKQKYKQKKKDKISSKRVATHYRCHRQRV